MTNQNTVEKLKEIVEYNRSLLEKSNGNVNEVIDELITLNFNGETIWNPFKDISLRYKVDPYEEYGEDEIKKFINMYKEE